MSEATQTATEPITETAPKLYPLDQSEFEIAIKIPGRNISIEHRLTKPTLAQLIERESQSQYETESINDGEEKVNADDEAANVRLWNVIVEAVKGYRLNKADAVAVDAWRGASPELIAAIPAAHKSTAVRGLYQFTCEVEGGNDDEGFTLGAETWTIKQTFGDPDFPDYVVRHILRTPTETERRDFKRKSSDIRFSKGAKRLRTKVVTHLKAHVELYDALIDYIDGTSVGTDGKGPAFRPLVDPIWKRQVIDTLMKSFEAGLSD